MALSHTCHSCCHSPQTEIDFCCCWHHYEISFYYLVQFFILVWCSCSLQYLSTHIHSSDSTKRTGTFLISQHRFGRNWRLARVPLPLLPARHEKPSSLTSSCGLLSEMFDCWAPCWISLHPHKCKTEAAFIRFLLGAKHQTTTKLWKAGSGMT